MFYFFTSTTQREHWTVNCQPGKGVSFIFFWQFIKILFALSPHLSLIFSILKHGYFICPLKCVPLSVLTWLSGLQWWLLIGCRGWTDRIQILLLSLFFVEWKASYSTSLSLSTIGASMYLTPPALKLQLQTWMQFLPPRIFRSLSKTN